MSDSTPSETSNPPRANGGVPAASSPKPNASPFAIRRIPPIALSPTSDPPRANGGVPPASGPKPDASHFTLRRIPPIGYAFQNVMISIGTIVSSFAALIFTVFCVFPLSIFRIFLPARSLSLTATAGKDFKLDEVLTKGKVILVVGGTGDMDYNIIMQYANDKDTTIIGLAQTADSLLELRKEFGGWPAKFQGQVLDLSSPPEIIAKMIQECDTKYGPISHMYALSSSPVQNKRSQQRGSDTTVDMVKVNVLGIASVAMSMYECMKPRRYGKICIIGYISDKNGPVNAISYASTRSFMSTFASKLRVHASKSNVDVVIVDPDFMNTRIASIIGGRAAEHAGPQLMASLMKEAVEMGGVGVVSLPIGNSVKVYALRAINPICDEFWNWMSMKLAGQRKKTA